MLLFFLVSSQSSSFKFEMLLLSTNCSDLKRFIFLELLLLGEFSTGERDTGERDPWDELPGGKMVSLLGARAEVEPDFETLRSPTSND
mmetsp:Transcript_18468/g.25572  ORF Transcript_18468/g.25572 Transcript_18468/m.25572 type:complete len:88 (-) Transcript_18468:1594-1857(-)